MINIINEERSWKELDNIPEISIAFPNGHFDNLVLDRFYPSAESRKIGKACEDIWPEKNCKEKASKGKCIKNLLKAKCQKTCGYCGKD